MLNLPDLHGDRSAPGTLTVPEGDGWDRSGHREWLGAARMADVVPGHLGEGPGQNTPAADRGPQGVMRAGSAQGTTR
jgi:hypothetical protein